MSDAVVHVVDDDDQARKAVSALIRAAGTPVIGYASAEEFLIRYDGRRPACLVTDVRMLGMSGLELQEELRLRGIDLPVVVLTAFATTGATVRAMQNGALTLLEKPCDDDELWGAVRNALAIDREATATRESIDELRRRRELLTAKEREVLACMAVGDPNKVIARKLGISVRTVEVHRRTVFQKMAADSLAELIRMEIALEGGQSPGSAARDR